MTTIIDDLRYQLYISTRQQNRTIKIDEVVFPNAGMLEERLRIEYELDDAGRIVAPKQMSYVRPSGPWDHNKENL